MDGGDTEGAGRKGRKMLKLIALEGVLDPFISYKRGPALGLADESAPKQSCHEVSFSRTIKS